MNFEYTADQQIGFKAFAKLCRDKIAPHAKEMDQGDAATVEARLRANLKLLGDFGYLGLQYPAEYGGQARPFVEAVVYHDELTRACPSTLLSAGASIGLGGGSIRKYASAEQKAHWLPELAAGRVIGALGLTEPDCGSDLPAIRTRAAETADGWIINGTKTLITNAPICDFAVVLAKLGKEGAEQGTGLFLVPRGTAGFTTSAPLAKMGYRGSPTGELILEDCRAPREALLGEKGHGLGQALKVLHGGRVGIASSAMGLAQACFDEAVKYANQRKTFGRKIIKYQEVSHKIADMKMLLDAGRLLVARAAWLMDIGDPEAEVVGQCAKVMASEAATKIAGWALQIHGGYGYLAEFPIERLYREAKLGEIGEGTNEIHRLAIARDCITRWA
jgi:alkylation response protein AidB-like acyl-CoA dehydrogenase